MTGNDSSSRTIPVLLVVANEHTRASLLATLSEHHYAPQVVSDPQEVGQFLRDQQYTAVFVDCQAVATVGASLYSKVRVACQICRVIFICDRTHQRHQELVKQAMELGAFACLLAPYNDWEVLALLKPSQPHKPYKKRAAKRS